ncbi:MAG: PilZ domain-containing protein [Gammaproteobacteria bacterium]|nr:PilZ domain-containing protein [Gammaproteobacteria bacterium]
MVDTVLGDGLVYEDSMPLGWSVAPPPASAELARLNADNLQLLGAEASLEEARVHEGLKDESPALVHELQRLEFKLNILLRLTADLAVQHSPLPPRQAVRLAARGLEWVGVSSPKVGESGLALLYINPALPQPLRLTCTCVGERVHDGQRVAQLRFEGLSEAVVDGLERVIFRHHRRLIAGAKIATN